MTNATTNGVDERPITRAEYTVLIIKVNDMSEKLDLILSKVDMVATEVRPTIDALLESPMLKMLTGGKKL